MDQQPPELPPQTPPERDRGVDYAVLPLPLRPKPLWRRVLPAIVIILLLAAIGAGVYWKFLRKQPPAQAPSPAATAQPQPPATTGFATQTKNYTSSSFGLSLDYPEDWKVNEAASDQLYITSPAIKLTDASGQNTTGKVMLSIKGKQQPQPEFDTGNAVAARDSEKIAYAKPSQNQRAQTYLSFLQYPVSASGALDGLYITGDTGYLKGQAIPKADFVPIEPIISVTFLKDCATCTADDSRISVAATMWDDSQFATAIKTMLQSLTIN